MLLLVVPCQIYVSSDSHNVYMNNVSWENMQLAVRFKLLVACFYRSRKFLVTVKDHGFFSMFIGLGHSHGCIF